MTKTADKLVAFANKFFRMYFLPLLLDTVVMKLIISTYTTVNVNMFTAVFVVWAMLLFFIFEKLKPHKIVRGIVYIVIAIGILIFSATMMQQGWATSEKTFIDWFYLNVSEVGFVQPYFLFVLFGLGFFITSITYYFTVLRYRLFGTMLIILFPFFIYGKRAETMSPFNITLMLTIFLALAVHSRLVTDEKPQNIRIKLPYVLSVAFFVALSGAIVMVLPLPTPISYLESNKNFFDLSIRNQSLDYTQFSSTSSKRFGSDTTGQTLFNLNSTGKEDIIYLRRQSYNYFSNNTWHVDTNADSNYSFTNDRMIDNETSSPSYLYKLMTKLAQSGKYANLGLAKNMYKSDLYSSTSWVNEYTDNSFKPVFLPAPLMISSSNDNQYSKSSSGYVMRSNPSTDLSTSYQYTMETSNEANFASNLTLDKTAFLNILKSAESNGDAPKNTYNNVTVLESIYSDTQYFDNATTLSLAQSIVSGKKSDYDKAQAFVSYFANNGYVYDNDYTPTDTSILYFITNSKRGNCTSYATAMTLMARQVGLSARYVEGFVAYEKNQNGEFVVRDSHAHAFVEVYISGIGWMTFDPTVADYRATNNGNTAGGINLSTFVSYFSRIVLFLAVVFVIVFIILLDRITELVFRINLKFTKQNEQKTLMLYRHIVKLLKVSSKEILYGYTPDMILEYAVSKREADIGKTKRLFEYTCFGGYKPTNDEYEAAYDEYKLNWKKLHKAPKPIKQSKQKKNDTASI